jgi:hypothetical protein
MSLKFVVHPGQNFPVVDFFFDGGERSEKSSSTVIRPNNQLPDLFEIPIF